MARDGEGGLFALICVCAAGGAILLIVSPIQYADVLKYDGWASGTCDFTWSNRSDDTSHLSDYYPYVTVSTLGTVTDPQQSAAAHCSRPRDVPAGQRCAQLCHELRRFLVAGGSGARKEPPVLDRLECRATPLPCRHAKHHGRLGLDRWHRLWCDPDAALLPPVLVLLRQVHLVLRQTRRHVSRRL